MTLRRLVVAAAAVAVAGTGAAVGAPAPTARAATVPSHVGIVVAGIGAACVPWHSGMTGADVLNAEHDVVYGQTPPYVGFVFTIDGTGSTHPDNTHYWAYFHDSGGGWVYSGSGAASYTPKAGTVEGWAYDNGASDAPRPPATSYAALCGALDPQVVSTPSTKAPSTARTTAPAAAPTRAPAGTRAGGSGAAGSGGGRASGSGAPGTGSAAPTHDTTSRANPSRVSRGPSAASPSSESGSSGSAPATASPASSSTTSAARDASATGSARPASIAALLAVLGLGGGAFWRMRRQRLS